MCNFSIWHKGIQPCWASLGLLFWCLKFWTIVCFHFTGDYLCDVGSQTFYNSIYNMIFIFAVWSLDKLLQLNIFSSNRYQGKSKALMYDVTKIVSALKGKRGDHRVFRLAENLCMNLILSLRDFFSVKREGKVVQ